MITKKLTALAGSIALASGVQAATVGNTSGTDSSVWLVLGGSTGDSLVVDVTAITGTTAADLQAGTGFQLNLNTASSFATFDASNSIANYSLFATLGDGGAYDTSTGDYMDPNLGVIFASTAVAPAISGNELINTVQAGLITYMNNAIGGFGVNNSFIASSLTAADFDNTGVAGLLGGIPEAAGNVSNLYLYKTDPAGRLANNPLQSQIDILSPDNLEGIFLDGSNFNVTNESTGPVVPVPAAAWLFGSALLGLGVVRRKKG